MRKLALISLSFLSLSFQASGQSLALYNLGNAVPQNARFNASFIPEGNTIIGIPVLSGLSVGLNSATSYNQLISKNTEGELMVDFDKMIRNLDENSFFHVNATIADLYLGFKMGDGFISFFANERVEANAFTPKEMVQFAWEGNSDFGGRFYNFSDFGIDFKYYREIGLGYAKALNNQIRIGGRLKMIQGILAGRSGKQFKTNIRTRENSFELDFEAEDARYDMAGKDDIENFSHIISNPSKGVALDIGINYQLNDLAHLAIGINDVGFVGWKGNPENFVLENTSFTWDGLELETVTNLGQQVKDSLIGKFDRTETEESFTTGLNTRSFISGLFNLTYQDALTVTLANRFVSGRILTTFGAGISHYFGKKLVLGATGSVTSQQGFDLGAAMAVNLGPVQIYTSYDHLLGLANVTKLDAVQFDFGINLIFGRSVKKSKDPRQEIIDRNLAAQPDYPASGSSYTPVIREEGIYQIIKEQKPNEPRKLKPNTRDFNEATDEKKRWTPPKDKKRRGDFNGQSDERGIKRYFFWKNWGKKK